VGIAGMQTKDGVVARWMSRHACLAAIVRPDRYVHGVATTPEQLPANCMAGVQAAGLSDG